MPRPRRQPPTLLVIVEGEIREWAVQVGVRPVRTGDAGHSIGGPSLVFKGVFLEPVKGQENFSFTVMPRREPAVASVEIGRIHHINPEIFGTLNLDLVSFESLITMAYAGQLKAFMMFFDPPFRGKASIQGCDFYAGARI